LGMALPDSYSATTCVFSLIAVANSFCVIFFAVRACGCQEEEEEEEERKRSMRRSSAVVRSNSTTTRLTLLRENATYLHDGLAE
jgi:hypothetical protein